MRWNLFHDPDSGSRTLERADRGENAAMKEIRSTIRRQVTTPIRNEDHVAHMLSADELNDCITESEGLGVQAVSTAAFIASQRSG